VIIVPLPLVATARRPAGYPREFSIARRPGTEIPPNRGLSRDFAYGFMAEITSLIRASTGDKTRRAAAA
jgi:hypothetical protein